MAQFDQLIAMMTQRHAERALLVSDKPMHLCVNGVDSTGAMIPAAALQHAVSEIVPPNLRAQLTQDGAFHFPHQSMHGSFEIGVARQGSVLQVSIVPRSAAPHGAPQGVSHGAANGKTNGHPSGSHAAPATAPPAHDVDEADDGALRFSGASSSGPKQEAIDDSKRTLIPGVTVTAERRGIKKIEHIDELFRLLYKLDASDLHLSSNETPMIRLQGIMRKLEEYEVNQHDHLKKLLFAIAPERNRDEWERDKDTDFAYELPGIARFRCNFFADRHGIGAVFRLIPSQVLTVEQLKLPHAMTELCFLSKGLVVVTGPTGSGKSTTLAALVDHINKKRDDHIITIEDPVEFVHNNINCLINQREVHVHTEGFKRALRAALREDPDIVLVGEMRDLETIAIAIETAETGHLVFGTLHTTTAPSTVDRIIDQFPSDQQAQIRVMLSESLKGVIAQTLLRTKDGKRVAAHEILLVPTAVANLIREGKTFQLPSQMQIGKSQGMITMNDSILKFVLEDRVDPLEGYIKSVDKVGLLSSYEANGIDFHPPGS
ncbi:MAG: twitching motility protein PilT [Abditibacteriota bacterium]|nr:twitching motility protein PilT [Abditibacteriota bacterium]